MWNSLISSKTPETEDPGRACRFFLSSFTAEIRKERQQIYDIGRQTANAVFVCEHSRSDLDPDHCDQMTIVDTLIENVRNCDVYLCVLTGNRQGENAAGTPVRFGNHVAAVSHFEMELFQAALCHKPIEILLTTDYSPGPRLAALLEILRFSLPELPWKDPVPKDHLPFHIDQIMKRHGRGKRASRSAIRRSHGRLVQKLYERRGRFKSGASEVATLQFLDGRFEARSKWPDRELVQSLLTDCLVLPNQERKLARLWMAVRELLVAPLEDRRYAEFLPLWNTVLGEWRRAGAWYGLHGHLHLGCLASLTTQERVRRQIHEQNIPLDDVEENLRPMNGPRSSLLYSIAKRIPNLRLRNELLLEADHAASSAIAQARGRSDGYLAIRGNIRLRRGRIRQAVKDLQEVLDLRTEKGNDPGTIGEAMVELGFAQLFQGKIFQAIHRMEDGVDRLASRHNKNFLVRAQRKLAIAYLLTARLGKARNLSSEANELANATGALDHAR